MDYLVMFLLFLWFSVLPLSVFLYVLHRRQEAFDIPYMSLLDG